MFGFGEGYLVLVGGFEFFVLVVKIFMILEKKADAGRQDTSFI